MPTNIQRSKGRSANYKFDRGGMPSEMGPYIGVVKNNVDSTRSGRLQVYIEQFGGDNPDDKSLWRTVSYASPFYGTTPENNLSTTTGVGNFRGNPQSYGMWFTPPDVDIQVICFFVGGDPNQGFYIGCLPDIGISHMIPAVGATTNALTQNQSQKNYADAAGATQLPVVESNWYNYQTEIDPKFFTQDKPVHSVIFGLLMEQGLLGDTIRGPISSSSQRESPSSVYGISTPGRPVYQGGLKDRDVKEKISAGAKLSDINIEGRRGGHTFVMDDGTISGQDNLIRLRTSLGHQITMSDDGQCLYFIHSNGQTWIELGAEGTVDIYASNSVNIRTQGELNLHADKNININAGENLNIRGKNIKIESLESTTLMAGSDLSIYSKKTISALADGKIVLNSDTGGWKSNNSLNLRSSRIDLNGGSSPETLRSPTSIQQYNLDDTKFIPEKGWQVQSGTLETIVNRAPTHEPYPYHNKGTSVQVDYSAASSASSSKSLKSALGSTANLQVQSPLTAGALLSTTSASSPIGSLNPAQVTGLVTSAKLQVGQSANALSVTKGIGSFGFGPEALEAAGLLKPGTVSKSKSAAPATPTAQDIAAATGTNMTAIQAAAMRQTYSLLSSPTVWTGQNGVSNLGSFLANEKLQEQTQQQLMSTTLSGLRRAGVVTGTETASELGPVLQTATKLGVAVTAAWSQGSPPPALTSVINNTIKNAQYSTNFISTAAAQLGSFGKAAQAATGTVNRSGVDSAVTSVVGDPKIDTPTFKPRSDQGLA
jgi:hypothetical protein